MANLSVKPQLQDDQTSWFVGITEKNYITWSNFYGRPM